MSVPDTNPDENSGAGPSARIQELSANKAFVGNTFTNNIYGTSTDTAPQLSLGQFETWSDDRLEALRRDAEFDTDHLDSLAARLGETRTLVLHGKREVGLTTMALLIAGSLRRQAGAEAVRVCRRPEGNLRTDMGRLLLEDDAKRCVLVLTEAFEENNADLDRFARRLKRGASVQGELPAGEAAPFLLLTTSVLEPTLQATLQNEDLLVLVEPPPLELLLAGFRSMAAREVSTRGGPKRTELEANLDVLLRDHERELGEGLRTFPRAARFVGRHLLDVLRGELELREALGRLSDPALWFTEELPRDLGAWASALSLVLCSSAELGRHVPWLQFELLRRILRRHIERDLRRHREPLGLESLCRGQRELELARIVVVRSGVADADRVTFEDPDLARRLWDLLLLRARDVVGLVLPALTSLAESESTDPWLRMAALRALGRLGQLDPSSLFRRRVAKLIALEIEVPVEADFDLLDEEHKTAAKESETVAVRYRDLRGLPEKTFWKIVRFFEACRNSSGGALPADRQAAGQQLGFLFQGALSSLDGPYRRSGSRLLERLRTQIRSTNLDLLALALGEVAQVRFDLATSELEKLLRGHLEIDWGFLRHQGAFLVSMEKEVRAHLQPGAVPRLIGALGDCAHTLLVSTVVPRHQQTLLSAVQIALSTMLGSQADPKPALRQLLGWIKVDPEHFGPLLTYLFLRRGGCATRLEGAPKSRQAPTGQRIEASPIMLALNLDEETSPILAGFIAELCVHLHVFPGSFSRLLDGRLRELLASWAEEARSGRALQPAVVGLLTRLLAAPQREVAAFVVELAQDPDPQGPFIALKQLAGKALLARPS